MANDNFFVLGFIYYHWLLFSCHGSYFHKAFTFFLLFAFVNSLGCVYLHSHLLCTLDGWFLSLIFIYKVLGFLFSSIITSYDIIPFDIIKFCDLIVYVHLLTIVWIGLDICTNIIHYHTFFQLGPYPLHKIQMECNQWEIDLRWSLKPMVVQGSFMCLMAMGHLYNDRGWQWNPKNGHGCWYTH